MAGNWNEECPHCGASIGYELDVAFGDGIDTGKGFEMDCPNCTKRIFVEVRIAPEFVTHKEEPSS